MQKYLIATLIQDREMLHTFLKRTMPLVLATDSLSLIGHVAFTVTLGTEHIIVVTALRNIRLIRHKVSVYFKKLSISSGNVNCNSAVSKLSLIHI